MARRSSGTPLYELIIRREPAQRPVIEAPDIVEVEDAPPSRWLMGGRVLRLPIGYIFLATAAVLVLLLGAYQLGWSRAEVRTQAEYERLLADAPTPGGGMRALDPLHGAPDSEDSTPVEGPAVLATPTPAMGRVPAVESEMDDARGWGPVNADPRQPGFYYFVLMETRKDGAEQLARFCRDRGLEAYVLPRHNDRFRVIALPGLPTRHPEDPEVSRLKDEIIRIGDAWKREVPGGSDLRDSYQIP